MNTHMYCRGRHTEQELKQTYTHIQMHIHILTPEGHHPLRHNWRTNLTYVHRNAHKHSQRHTEQQLLHNCCSTHIQTVPTRWSVRVQCSRRLCPQFVSINLIVARRGLVRRSASLCNLLLMCCTLSLSEPIWSDCEQTEIPPMLSEQVLLMGLSIRPSPITACLQSSLNTLHRRSPDFCG